MIDVDGYLTTRVDNQIEWYDNKSVWNQKQYKKFRIASNIISVIIPILTLLLDKDLYGLSNKWIAIIIAIASAVVVVIQGIITLYKFQDNWTNYRATSENLKYHKYLFETQTPPYNEASAFPTFVQNVENVLANERIRWVKGNQQESGKSDKSESTDSDKKSEGEGGGGT